MIMKASHLSYYPTCIINSVIQEHSGKILYEPAHEILVLIT